MTDDALLPDEYARRPEELDREYAAHLKRLTVECARLLDEAGISIRRLDESIKRLDDKLEGWDGTDAEDGGGAVRQLCPSCGRGKSPQAKTCRSCMPSRRGRKYGPRKAWLRDKWVDPHAHLGPLLVKEGAHWRFTRDVTDYHICHPKAGDLLFHEPWISLPRAPDPLTGKEFYEEWSFGSETRRSGIPADWALELLAGGGAL